VVRSIHFKLKFKQVYIYACIEAILATAMNLAVMVAMVAAPALAFQAGVQLRIPMTRIARASPAIPMLAQSRSTEDGAMSRRSATHFTVLALPLLLAPLTASAARTKRGASNGKWAQRYGNCLQI